MFRELTILSDVCLAVFLLGCEAFPTGERLSPSWLKYTFFVFRSHWFACSVTFLSVGQFGFGVIGDAGFYVLLYVDRLHLLVPVLGTHLCGGSPWYLYLTTCSLAWPRVEQVACCGRVGQEAKLGSRYSQLLTNTYVVRFRLERYTLMFRELTISSDVCLAVFLLGCEAFPTGERLSPSWLKYTFFRISLSLICL